MRILAAVILISLAAWSKSHVDEGEAARTHGLPVVVPPASLVRTAALGYYGFAADLYWLKSLEYFGDKRYRQSSFNALVPMLELIVELDPKLCIVYRQAGLILTSSEKSDVAAADRLLYRGIEQCPNDTYVHFVLGFNLYYFEHRFAEAGRILQKAATLPDAPEWLGDLALRVTARETDLQALETMLQVMIESESDERARASSERRLRYVRTEMLLRNIDAQLKQAPEAKSIDDLVRLGLMPAGVQDPSGGTLSIEAGLARSSKYTSRLQLKDEAINP